MVFQPPLKFILSVRALQLGELVFDFAIARLEVQLLRLFEQNFVVDQLVEHVELLRQRFFQRRLLPLGVHARAIVFVDFIALDLFPVYHRPHVGRVPRLLVAARGGGKYHRRQGQPCYGALDSL